MRRPPAPSTNFDGESVRSPVPTGKVKWYDSEKGFGFLTRDDGGEVFVHSSALPGGTESLRSGQRVEFGVVEGRKGAQALQVELLDTPRRWGRSSASGPTRWWT